MMAKLVFKLLLALAVTSTCVDSAAFDDDDDNDDLSINRYYLTEADLIRFCGLSPAIPTTHRVSEKSTASQSVASVFNLEHFIELQDEAEMLHLSGSLVFTWNASCFSDDFYKRALQFRIGQNTSIYVRDWTKVFHPRVRLRNSVHDSGMTESFDSYLQVFITNLKGNETFLQFTWTRYGRFSVKCSLDLVDFPFDIQTCQLLLASHLPSINLTSGDIVMGYMGSNVVTDNAAWSLIRSDVALRAYSGRSSELIYKFQFMRRSRYYTFSLLLPCFILTWLEIFAIWFPPKSIHRTVYQITVVLALIFMLFIVLDKIPRTPERVFLTSYILLESLICAACTAESIFVCGLYHAYEHKAERKVGCAGMALVRVIDLVMAIVIIIAYILLNAWAIAVAYACTSISCAPKKD